MLRDTVGLGGSRAEIKYWIKLLAVMHKSVLYGLLYWFDWIGLLVSNLKLQASAKFEGVFRLLNGSTPFFPPDLKFTFQIKGGAQSASNKVLARGFF